MNTRITLEQRISRLENAVKKFEADNGATLVYTDDLWDVYKINTRSAARRYGAGTRWYLLGEDDFGNYVFDITSAKYDIYFYIKKAGRAKYCLSKKKGGRKVAIFDKQDEEIQPKAILLEEPDFPSVQGLFSPPAVNKSAKNIEKLCNAVVDGKLSAVNKLIDSGINVNARCSSGTTPLYLALMWHQVDVMIALLDSGADPNLPGDESYPTMTIPLKKAKLDRRADLADLLKQYGAHD